MYPVCTRCASKILKESILWNVIWLQILTNYNKNVFFFTCNSFSCFCNSALTKEIGAILDKVASALSNHGTNLVLLVMYFLHDSIAALSLLCLSVAVFLIFCHCLSMSPRVRSISLASLFLALK